MHRVDTASTQEKFGLWMVQRGKAGKREMQANTLVFTLDCRGVWGGAQLSEKDN